MTDSNSQQATRPETSRPATSNERLSRGARIVSQSARSAEAAIQAHPYFAAGVLAGIGLAAGGAFLYLGTRRRTLLDRVLGWF
jgi:ElaB/YqjD/DUF883 family membrane-anchored ribosome-binding protein